VPFWIRWTLATTLGVVGGALIWVAVLVMPGPFLGWRMDLGWLDEPFLEYCPLVLLGICGAALAQWRLLSRRLTGARRWLAATTIGGALGIAWSAAAAMFAGEAVELIQGRGAAGGPFALALWVVLSPIGGIILGSLQQRVLRPLPRAQSWPLVTAAAGAVAVPASIAASFGTFAIAHGSWLAGRESQYALSWLDFAMSTSVAVGLAVGWAIVALPTGVLLDRMLAEAQRRGAFAG
jgi:hypothetical protein